MNDELRAMLVELGMPEETSDEEAQRWLLENADVKVGDAGQKPADGERKDPVIPEAVVAGADGGNVTADSIRNMIGQAVSEAVTGIEQQRREAESKFRSEVDAMIELSGADVPDAEKHRFYSMANADEVRTALINQRAERQESVFHAPGVVTMGAAQIDKHRSAMKTALTMRCIDSNAPVDGSKGRQEAIEKMFPVEQRSKDWEQFRHATILDLAGECIRADGFDTRNMTKEDIAIVALGFGDQIRDQIGQSYRSDSAYHTTGSFPILTQDAINKSMMLGQAEFPSTWRGPMRQGQSATDFKTIHRMQLGAVPNLPVWNDTKDPDQVSVADAEETYAVECYSEALSFNYKALVNDDMDFISRMPFRMSVAAARTVNATAWAQVTGNPTMRDQKALFLATPAGKRFRSNLTTGAGAPSSATIQTLTNKMMQMRGENTPEDQESEDILSLMPRYLILPSALRTTGLKEVRSIADPNGTHSGDFNTSNDLIPIVEPLLDANSTTAWYLFAAPTLVETVEVTFLQGQETPRTRTIRDEKKLAIETIILQTFAAKALDHRGMQRHDGA